MKFAGLRVTQLGLLACGAIIILLSTAATGVYALYRSNEQSQALIKEQQQSLINARQTIQTLSEQASTSVALISQESKKVLPSPLTQPATHAPAQAQSATPTPSPQKRDLAAIVQEWRSKTAYIVCGWSAPNTNPPQIIQLDSGSGLVASFSGIGIEVVTNKHVLVDPSLGPASSCFFKFPGDMGFYADDGSGSFIRVNSNGQDVGYISGWKQLGSTGFSESIAQRATPLSVCKGKASTGDPVVIIGYPDYGSSARIELLSQNLDVTATEGIISGFDGDYYTTSAKIEPGNSGGLAIDEIQDCYLGIPSAAVVGEIESLGRILPVSLFM